MTRAMTESEASIVHARSSGLCERCQVSPGHQLHHRRKRGMGGTSKAEVHAASNVVHLCAVCHGWVHRYPRLARDGGWDVSQWSDPSNVAVAVGDGCWWLLHDDGEKVRLEDYCPSVGDVADYVAGLAEEKDRT